MMRLECVCGRQYVQKISSNFGTISPLQLANHRRQWALFVLQKDHQPPVWPLAHTESTHMSSGNVGKLIHFLPAKGHDIVIYTSFLTVSNHLAANGNVCLHVCAFFNIAGQWKVNESCKNARICVFEREKRRRLNTGMFRCSWVAVICNSVSQAIRSFISSVQRIPEITSDCFFLFCGGALEVEVHW